MENEVVKEMRSSMVRHFLDLIVLSKLKERGDLSGYDIIQTIHSRYGILSSSGTVYSLLYALERDGLISGELREGKRLFKLTEKGKEYIEAVQQSKEEILKFMQTILGNQ